MEPFLPYGIIQRLKWQTAECTTGRKWLTRKRGGYLKYRTQRTVREKVTVKNNNFFKESGWFTKPNIIWEIKNI